MTPTLSKPMSQTLNTATTKLLKIRKRPKLHPKEERRWAHKLLPKVAIKISENGSAIFTIRVPSRGLLKSSSCDIYDMVEFVGDLDVLIDCDGISVKPTMVLKIYCKLGPKEAPKALHNAALAAARANSPMLS